MSRAILPLLILGAVGAMAFGSQSAKAAPPEKQPPPPPPENKAPPPPPVVVPVVKLPPPPPAVSAYSYGDSNGIGWLIRNESIGVWTAQLLAAPTHPAYASGLPFVRSDADQLRQAIEERAAMVRAIGAV